MLTAQLDDFVCVPLPSELYQSLSERYPDRISTILESIAWDFLERTENDFNLTPNGGVKWSGLLLPNETQLRVRKSHSNEYGYAEIIGDQIIYQGKSVRSPSLFARKVRNNTNVNAWVNVEIKRPQDRAWKLANTFRK